MSEGKTSVPVDLVSPEGWLEAIWGPALWRTHSCLFSSPGSRSISESWHRTRRGQTLMEWTWISLSIVGELYMWRSAVCYFNRYEWADRETLPSTALAEKIRQVSVDLTRARALVSESLSCVCLDVTSGRGVLMTLWGRSWPVCQVAWITAIHLTLSQTPTRCSSIRTKALFICVCHLTGRAMHP